MVPTFEMRWRVRALVGLARLYVRGFHDVDVLAPARLPREGACVVAPNHTSGLDPLLVQSVLSRPIAWMMTSEYFDLRALNWFLRRVGCVRVDREKRDASAVREARRRLADGRVLGIFPEGRIEKADGELLPLQAGAAALAVKAGVPIVPVWVEGTMRSKPGEDAKPMAPYVRRHRARLAFGRPLEPGDDARDLTARLEAELRRLRTVCRSGAGEKSAGSPVRAVGNRQPLPMRGVSNR